MCLMYETKTVKGTLRSRVRCWGKRFRSIWMSQSETSDESIQTYERSVRVCKLHVTVHRLLLSRPLTIAPQHKDNKRVCILKFAFIFPASCFTLVWSCYTKWPPRVPPTQKHQPLMLNHDRAAFVTGRSWTQPQTSTRPRHARTHTFRGTHTHHKVKRRHHCFQLFTKKWWYGQKERISRSPVGFEVCLRLLETAQTLHTHTPPGTTRYVNFKTMGGAEWRHKRASPFSRDFTQKWDVTNYSTRSVIFSAIHLTWLFIFLVLFTFNSDLCFEFLI